MAANLKPSNDATSVPKQATDMISTAGPGKLGTASASLQALHPCQRHLLQLHLLLQSALLHQRCCAGPTAI
jgi:hypothetical protein